MELEQKILRHKWLLSQRDWHSKRIGKWHKNQSAYYSRVAGNIFSFSDILSITFRKNIPALKENLIRNNSLFKRLLA